MSRTMTPEREELRDWAIILAGLGLTQEVIGKWVGAPRRTVDYWLEGAKITDNVPFILDKDGVLVSNTGVVVKNLRDGLPPPPKPRLFAGRAESMDFLADESVDIVITSPPYNLGQEKWPMGGNGRTPREAGIGYSEHEDDMTEEEYQGWQVQCLREFYRVAKPGASLFYNHKVRQRDGEIIHPIVWLQGRSSWTLRQEIVWDRLSTHNHSATLFWPQDERIYWMTKGKPNLGDRSVGVPSVWREWRDWREFGKDWKNWRDSWDFRTVWREFGPIPKPNGGHPAPFTPALPRMILSAVGKPGDVILDPFGGGMTTCLVASAMGYHSIGVDKDESYVQIAAKKFGVTYGHSNQEPNGVPIERSLQAVA
jgi:DNA modification methylase